MKKKKLIIVVLALIVPTMIFVLCFFSCSKSLIKGYSLECVNEVYMIIDEDGSPIHYSYDNVWGTSVKKLEQGDKIIMISGVIGESYPGSTRAYIIVKYADGDIEDIPSKTLQSLIDMGWYKENE